MLSNEQIFSSFTRPDCLFVCALQITSFHHTPRRKIADAADTPSSTFAMPFHTNALARIEEMRE